MRKPTEREAHAAADRIAARHAQDDARLGELLNSANDALIEPDYSTLAELGTLSPEDLANLTAPLSPEQIATLTAPPNLAALIIDPPELPQWSDVLPDLSDDVPDFGRDDE